MKLMNMCQYDITGFLNCIVSHHTTQKKYFYCQKSCRIYQINNCEKLKESYERLLLTLSFVLDVMQWVYAILR